MVHNRGCCWINNLRMSMERVSVEPHHMPIVTCKLLQCPCACKILPSLLIKRGRCYQNISRFFAYEFDPQWTNLECYWFKTPHDLQHMHPKFTKPGRFCKQSNQLPTKTRDELKDNSIIFSSFDCHIKLRATSHTRLRACDHFKHSHWWKRRSRSKFALDYAWETNGVCECKMDIKSTWIPTWHPMDHVSWLLGICLKTTSWW